ncbi:zinc finger CW-type PWWP domain protein 2 [Ascaphus truei]|uniref:zinc finger CW-type PWWP domain protein 2 n=1 Tax=Ascaphus truei TaxID=8439 RepID=UPI003F5902B4
MENVTKNNSFEINFYSDKVWLQCENESCFKWRLLTKKDAVQVDLSKPWYCHLSSDPRFNDCSVPEEHFPEESQFFRNGLNIVYSQYPMGSLVMVKLSPWPSWPGIICPDPSTGQEVTHDSDGCVKYYHVEFLGKPHTRARVSVATVNPYHTSLKPIDQKKQKKWYETALEEAKQVFALTCEQRIDMCHLTKTCMQKLQRPKRKYMRKNNSIIESYKRKKKLYYFEGSKADVLSRGNTVVSETEGILQDLEKVLKQVAEPFCTTQKLLQEKQVHSAGEKMVLNEDIFEDCSDDEDCIIIDGITFKTGKCIEAITDNFEHIDTLMSELSDTVYFSLT